MVSYRIVDRPAFRVAGRSVWISGQDNAQFGQFWAQCKEDGTFERFRALTGLAPGAVTGGCVVGVSRVEADPAKRAFDFMVTVEVPEDAEVRDLATYSVPASRWAVFEAHGAMPEALVTAEMTAFMTWLPTSGYVHALAPELEVYPPASKGEDYCEFWLPIVRESE